MLYNYLLLELMSSFILTPLGVNKPRKNLTGKSITKSYLITQEEIYSTFGKRNTVLNILMDTATADSVPSTMSGKTTLVKMLSCRRKGNREKNYSLTGLAIHFLVS